MPHRALIVDANILVWAVLGKRVRAVIEMYGGQVTFFAPERAYEGPTGAKPHAPAQSNPMDGDFDTDSIIYKVRHVLGGTLLRRRVNICPLSFSNAVAIRSKRSCSFNLWRDSWS